MRFHPGRPAQRLPAGVEARDRHVFAHRSSAVATVGLVANLSFQAQVLLEFLPNCAITATRRRELQSNRTGELSRLDRGFQLSVPWAELSPAMR